MDSDTTNKRFILSYDTTGVGTHKQIALVLSLRNLRVLISLAAFPRWTVVTIRGARNAPAVGHW